MHKIKISNICVFVYFASHKYLANEIMFGIILFVVWLGLKLRSNYSNFFNSLMLFSTSLLSFFYSFFIFGILFWCQVKVFCITSFLVVVEAFLVGFAQGFYFYNYFFFFIIVNSTSLACDMFCKICYFHRYNNLLYFFKTFVI